MSNFFWFAAGGMFVLILQTFGMTVLSVLDQRYQRRESERYGKREGMRE